MIISEKYGLNPPVGLCFYCQEAKEVVLLGANGGKEAPRQAVYNTEPCNKCKEWMKVGVICISVKDDQEPSNNPYRTGKWCVIKAEAAERIFASVWNKDVLNNIMEHRVAFIEDQVWEWLGLPTEVSDNG